MSSEVTPTNPYKIEPMKAIRALGALVKEPEDTAQVYTIVRALAGKSHLRTTNQFRSSTFGAKLLEERRELLDLLVDRAAIGQLPAGSFGRAYLDFITRENISAEGLIEAGESVKNGEEDDTTDEAFVGRRLREMHDTWHVLTGYGRDGFGELCVLSFSTAQNWNPGFAAIVAIGTIKIANGSSWRKVVPAVREAYRNGKNAAWLLEQDYDTLFSMPLEDVRTKLNIQPAPHYQSADNIIEATRPEAVKEGGVIAA